MYLDERSSTILDEILRHSDTSFSNLENKYNLSMRQIEYSLEKINDWLGAQAQLKIKRENGRFLLDESLYHFFDKKNHHDVLYYTPSKEDRGYLILLYILLRDDLLSLESLSQKLGVSKNTVLNDIKNGNNLLKKSNLEVLYSRSNGYYTGGAEWDKRKIIVEVLLYLSQKPLNNHISEILNREDQMRILRIKSMLKQIETETNQNFIDARHEILPYELNSFIKRVNSEKSINVDFIIHFDDLIGTKEYTYIESFFKSEGIDNEVEKLYFSLHLLSVSRSSTEFTHNNDLVLDELEASIYASIDNFETISLVQVIDKEMLVNKLMLHMKPAYYRIKYDLTNQYDVSDSIENELSAMNYLVSESLNPLRKLLGKDIPHIEMLYITLFVSSHIKKEQRLEIKQKIKKAIVVCPNGVTISSVLKSGLKDLLPELDYYQTMSIREYEKTEYDHDIVFTTNVVSERANVKYYRVNSLMDKHEKLKLRERVMRDNFYTQYKTIDIDALMNIIEQHTELEDTTTLRESLWNEIYPSDQIVQNNAYKTSKLVNLYELLTPKYIKFSSVDATWHELITIATKPLIEDGSVDLSYLETMHNLYDDVSDHIMFNRKIAIPHASPESGVNKLGMSMLILDKPYVSGIFSINFIVVIATPNKEIHFDALMQLNQLSSNEKLLNEILSETNKQEISKKLKQLKVEA